MCCLYPTMKAFRVMWQFVFMHHYLKLLKPAIQIHITGSVCLCEASVLWMTWFVCLIPASHPFPLCDIQINTLPLAFVLSPCQLCSSLQDPPLVLASRSRPPPFTLLSSRPCLAFFSPFFISSHFGTCQEVSQCSETLPRKWIMVSDDQESLWRFPGFNLMAEGTCWALLSY